MDKKGWFELRDNANRVRRNAFLTDLRWLEIKHNIGLTISSGNGVSLVDLDSGDLIACEDDADNVLLQFLHEELDVEAAVGFGD